MTYNQVMATEKHLEIGENLAAQELQEKARELRNEYQRNWNHKNRDKVREYQRKWRMKNKSKTKASRDRYWLKKAAEATSSTSKGG